MLAPMGLTSAVNIVNAETAANVLKEPHALQSAILKRKGKNMSKLRLLTVACLMLVTIGCGSEEEQIIVDTSSNAAEDKFEEVLPKRQGSVNDYMGLLRPGEKDTLKMIIDAHEKQTGNKMVVVVVKDYGKYLDVDDFLEDLDNTWDVGIGSDKRDQGLILLLNPIMGDLRISAGAPLASLLPNSEIDRINNKGMFPHFAAGRYYEGLSVGLVELAKVLEKAMKDNENWDKVEADQTTEDQES